MKFIGIVTKIVRTADGNKYSVVEIKNKINVNYRLFIPEEFRISEKLMITVEPTTTKKPELQEKK